ncbi:Lrp/AsnC family transcriptional regulator [Ketogulonicigenium vulgare]|uniref:Transcriptional regulator, AsnC family protein n=1 Tax=Ketogulonicigenium vulgare (strain WSH-001) TaxID=759362 RepID=F9Y7V8_KETVW|nr:Lrp/AsnC family transcriptional regulator [Ketogulonicigenium vulgare]ADO41687.1 transcriptional regulator protein [Ketogulonicigenium vulgare Y25]AEM39924.1 transcriptional regulator, AsnC family protein [Ketogulonicigenium vulgare WSH-001]ALJ80139.1 ArsR family transcriptional regulator [Ketogulonicigenium vulgare]ANW33006.1 ArsR family transcriptional regulator [Ketogulonicigenium vulgare]AOZ53619.1 transcriptional regulator protein [Ketogulonicigenium vulgare]
MIDDRDRKLLNHLQSDADISISDLADRVALSVSACWRRVRRLYEQGFVARRIAVLDRQKMNVPTTVYMMIQTSDHSIEWLEKFRQAVLDIPEIIEVHRLTGNIDYLLKVVLPNVEHLDAIYKMLVNKVNFVDVSSYISMEGMKETTMIPTSYA